MFLHYFAFQCIIGLGFGLETVGLGFGLETVGLGFGLETGLGLIFLREGMVLRWLGTPRSPHHLGSINFIVRAPPVV